MKALVKKVIGDAEYTFEVEEKDFKETLSLASVLGSMPNYCNECKNTEHFTLESNRDKEGNIYVNVCCKNSGCWAKAKLGSYKTGGYFWHKFEIYKKPEESAY